MLTEVSLEKFKSWDHVKEMRYAPITGLFGSNSSGKTSILQWLLMLKQTAESADRLGLSVSAGHGLNYVNIKRFRDLKMIEEYSIGHSIVARAIFGGFERAVREMAELVKDF